MRNRILTISHSTKILKHPVDNVKQKKYFFYLCRPGRRTDHLAELAKIAGNGNFPFPRPFPIILWLLSAFRHPRANSG